MRKTGIITIFLCLMCYQNILGADFTVSGLHFDITSKEKKTVAVTGRTDISDASECSLSVRQKSRIMGKYTK